MTKKGVIILKEITLNKMKDLYSDLKAKKCYNENELINSIIENFKDELIFNSNEILVYTGTYILKHETKRSWYPVYGILLDENLPSAQYKKFKDLESGFSCYINLNELPDFEKDNFVIYIPNARHYENEYTFQQDYMKLRHIFFKEAIINGQDAALNLVSSEEKIKELFSVGNHMKEQDISPDFYKYFYEVAICNKKNKNVFSKKI